MPPGAEREEIGMTENRFRELKQILAPIASDLRAVAAEMEKQIASFSADLPPQHARLLSDPVRHLFNFHGKYLRPSLVLLSARAVGADAASHDALIEISAAVELMHSASLVHDDVIDEADRRRDQKSLNAVFGNKMAVLVGDLLYGRLFTVLKGLESLGHARQIRLFDIFCTTTQQMCIGEILEDRLQEQEDPVSYGDYLAVIESKTASLMAASCEASALVSGATPAEIGALKSFGLNLGFAYQLVDDILDNDGLFHDRQVIASAAADFGRDAKSALDALDQNSAALRLDRLVDFVLQEARVRKTEVQV
jgi:geranylgeranyl pyrophosphate synthase